MNPLAHNEDPPKHIPASFHPPCSLCRERHSPFEPCPFLRDSDQSAMIKGVWCLLLMPLLIIGIALIAIAFS